MLIVHFICRGNAHRSLMAEAYLKSLGLKDIAVLSSGTSANKYLDENLPRIPHIKAILAKHNVAQFAKDHPEQLTQERVDKGDITICMNPIVADECNQSYKMPTDTQVWSIDDTGEGQHILSPGDNPFKFTEEIYSSITQKVDELIDTLARV